MFQFLFPCIFSSCSTKFCQEGMVWVVPALLFQRSCTVHVFAGRVFDSEGWVALVKKKWFDGPIFIVSKELHRPCFCRWSFWLWGLKAGWYWIKTTGWRRVANGSGRTRATRSRSWRPETSTPILVSHRTAAMRKALWGALCNKKNFAALCLFTSETDVFLLILNSLLSNTWRGPLSVLIKHQHCQLILTKFLDISLRPRSCYFSCKCFTCVCVCGSLYLSFWLWVKMLHCITRFNIFHQLCSVKVSKHTKEGFWQENLNKA